MANDPNDAVEKVLAALKHATPPQGMEARIAQRLQHASAQPTPAPRALFRASTLAGAWWRGALTGAASAGIVACALLFLAHHAQPKPILSANAAPTAAHTAPNQVSSPITPVSLSRPTPCATPAVLHPRSPAPTPFLVATVATPSLRAESSAPSRPAPALALTAPERELMRLARTPDPRQLATIATEDHAKLEAQDEADFERLITPPQPADTPAKNE